MHFRWTILGVSLLIAGGCNLFESVGVNEPDAVDMGSSEDASMTLDQSSNDMGTGPGSDAAADSGVDTGTDMPEGRRTWNHVSAGYQHSCAIADDGQAYCWGRGLNGRTGLGNESNTSGPQPVLTMQRFDTIDAGGAHTCAIDVDGALWCWGLGANIGVVGTENVVIPTLVDSGPFVDVSAGADHTCVVTSTNDVQCTGSNELGQAGIENVGSVSTLQAVEGLQTESVEAGVQITCAIDLDGIVSCWGRDLTFREAEEDPTWSATPAQQDTRVYQKVSVGEQSVCGLSGTEIYCWGSAHYLREDRPDFEIPAPIDSPFEFVDVSTGTDFGCGLANNDLSFCWGSNYRARMATGGHESSPSVSRGVSAVNTTEVLKMLSAGHQHGCAITTEDELRCWGRELYGRTGTGELGYRTTPVRVETDEKFSWISAGEYHSCGVLTDGRVACWGRGSYSAIGVPGTDEQPFPVILDYFSDAEMVESSNSRNCAVTSTGELACWGSDTNGTLGNGRDLSDTETPNPVDSTASFRTVSMNNYSTCAVTTNNQGACWGGEGYVGADVGQQSSPYVLSMHPGYVDIANGFNHGCGISESGNVHCWGFNNEGQLGQGGRSGSLFTPLLVDLNLTFERIEAGTYGTCALSDAQKLFCWGRSTIDGVSGGDSLSPEAVRSDLDFTWIDGSRRHVCAIADGEVYCWGEGYYGHLGQGFLLDEAVPTAVSLPDTAVQVSVGEEHTCALLESGDAYCWGLAEFSALGHGQLGYLDTPTPLDESAVQ